LSASTVKLSELAYDILLPHVNGQKIFGLAENSSETAVS